MLIKNELLDLFTSDIIIVIRNLILNQQLIFINLIIKYIKMMQI